MGLGLTGKLGHAWVGAWVSAWVVVVWMMWMMLWGWNKCSVIPPGLAFKEPICPLEFGC